MISDEFYGGIVIGFVIGFLFTIGLIFVCVFNGPFNENYVEPLAHQACESEFGTYALSYEDGVLECSKEPREVVKEKEENNRFVMDLKEEE